MNKQEIEKAIHTLECARLYIFENSNRQDYSLEALDRLSNAVDDVVSTLEQQLTGGWIPVSSGRLPEEKISPITHDYYEYECTFNSGRVIEVRHYKFGDGHWWHGPGCVDDYVTAWRERPEPYKEDKDAERD